ncbi:MAG: PAS domain S-box protein [Acidobacteriia bacterium]|nr:PAS domain S-box protein [Terriglobia bacterium]
MSAATPFPLTRESTEPGLRPLFTNAPMGFAKCSQQGTITEMNPAMEQMLGYGVPQCPSLSDLLGPADHAETDQLLRQMVAGERISFQVEHPLLDRVGSSTWVKWTAWQVPAANGESEYTLLVAEDTTANRQAERRLRQAEKLETVGRMAGSIAHDFNNLVTGVLLYCDLLLAEMHPGTRSRKYVEEIRTAGLQATGVVKQLLAAARPQESPACPLLLNDIIEGTRNLLVRLVGENKTLRLSLDPDLGLVRMKPAQVQQILLNLVLNARDAVPEGGQISIETSNCAVQIVSADGSDETGCHDGMPAALPCAVVVVTDNGTGMDTETKEHMFDPFFTTKTPDQGTGLGLTTVHDIVTSSGGLIHVDSAPGRGTRVTVLLPLVPETAGQSRPHAIRTPGNEGAPPQLEKEFIP